MNGERPSCRGMNVAGEQCGSPIVGADGWCCAHRPGGEEEMRERRRRAAEATARRLRAGGLEPDDLPPLRTPQDAETWLERIGRAVATGELANRDADAATRAVRAWLQAHDAGTVAERIAELQEVVETLKARRDIRAVP